MNDNLKKTLFYIVTIVFLLVFTIGISYAIYKFSFTGTKENSIMSGNLSLSYEEKTNIVLTNQYPESDVIGSSKADNLVFTVGASITGTASLKYDIGINIVSEGISLTTSYIKFNLKKDGVYLLNTSETSGITIENRKNIAGTNKFITSYALDSDVFNASGQKVYELKAWISEDYSPAIIDIGSGNVQGGTVNSEIFKFKISIIGSQF